MKKLNIYTIFALLLMTRSVAVYAQEYVPIIQEGNVWNTLDVTVGMYNTYYNNVNWFSGDTIIDDVQYAKLMGTTDGDAPTSGTTFIASTTFPSMTGNIMLIQF